MWGVPHDAPQPTRQGCGRAPRGRGASRQRTKLDLKKGTLKTDNKCYPTSGSEITNPCEADVSGLIDRRPAKGLNRDRYRVGINGFDVSIGSDQLRLAGADD
jgi:hypothetical protein